MSSVNFDISGKVALISGAAEGIGFACARELLKNGLKGVTVADVNNELGPKSVADINNEFGPNKALFVRTDVADYQSYENAFKQTVEHFKHLDIVVNNAGIFNAKLWEKEIAVILNGTVNGVLLGLENYIPKYKTDEEGVIINVSSIAGIDAFGSCPIYSSAKFGVIGLTQAFGDQVHHQRTKIRVLSLCPGYTYTSLGADPFTKALSEDYAELSVKECQPLIDVGLQQPESVALGAVKIIQNANSGTIWVAEYGKDPYEVKFP